MQNKSSNDQNNSQNEIPTKGQTQDIKKDVRIMIVDDDQSFIDSVKFWPFDSVRIGLYTEPIKALEEISAFKPDIIITDIMMPNVNGIQVANIISGLFQSADIVLISANSEKEITANTKLDLPNFTFYRKPIEKGDKNSCKLRVQRDIQISAYCRSLEQASSD